MRRLDFSKSDVEDGRRIEMRQHDTGSRELLVKDFQLIEIRFGIYNLRGSGKGYSIWFIFEGGDTLVRIDFQSFLSYRSVHPTRSRHYLSKISQFISHL